MKTSHRVTCDQCRYGRQYKKPTDIWTNMNDLQLHRCQKQCGFMDGNRHIQKCGLQRPNQMIETYVHSRKGNKNTLDSIPTPLISSILDQINYP